MNKGIPTTLPEERLELSNLPLFSRLSAEELCYISAYGVVRTYPKHTILIHEKDSNGSLYLLLRGRVKIYLSGENGKDLMLNVHSSGEYFGELKLIDSGPFEHPAIAFELLRSLAQRVRLLTEHVKSLALDS